MNSKKATSQNSKAAPKQTKKRNTVIRFSERQVLVLHRLLRSPATVKQLRLCQANNIPDVVMSLRRKNIHIVTTKIQGSIGTSPYGVYSLTDESKRMVRKLLGAA